MWWTLVNVVMNLQVPLKCGEYSLFPSWSD